MQRRQLTIALRRDSDSLVRRYHQPVFGWLDGECPLPQPLAEIGAAFQVGGRAGLDALAFALGRGVPAELDEHLSGAGLDRAGELLFELLFGRDEARWQHVIRRATSTPEPSPTPTRVALRVRVLTDVPELLGLPWRIITWRGFLLCDLGWTFEVCARPEATARIDYRSPGRVLVVAPREAAVAGRPVIESDRHVDDVASLLDTIAAGFTRSGDYRVARTRAELEDACRRLAPDFVYFYGHGELRDGLAVLRLGEGAADTLLMRDLGELLRERPPRVVFLNGCWTGQGGWSGAGHQLAPLVPVVIANSTAADAANARAYALDWLEAWLGRGQGPVEAAHARPPATKRFSDWTPAVVYADYDTFATSRPTTAPIRADNVEDWLDRDKQRAVAYKHVADLVRHERQRVEALLAYGRPGNGIERVSQQIIDFIEREAGDRIHVQRVVVPFPEQRGADLREEHFDHGLKARLGVDPRDPIARALAARAPLPQGDAARVLWLDWGVLRDQPSYGDEVFAWLRFARDYLAGAPFAGFHVIALLAAEASGDAFAALAENLPDLRSDAELWTDRFRCVAVEPLGDVSRADLLSFLDKNGCDPGDVRDLADAIFEDTKGAYDATKRHLRDGLRLGWRVLLRRFPPRARGRSRKF